MKIIAALSLNGRGQGVRVSQSFWPLTSILSPGGERRYFRGYSLNSLLKASFFSRGNLHHPIQFH